MISRTASECIQHLKAFSPPPTLWHSLPLGRRSAVLILLHPNADGDLNVVLTMRSNGLSSFSNQAAFPGGKADLESESPFTVARREASEEIGFPQELNESKYRFENLTELPCHLARNWLVVRPCVGFVSHRNVIHDGVGVDISEFLSVASENEVSAIFTVPFDRFLSAEKGWYKGTWMDWAGLRWRQHIFSVKASASDILPESLSSPKKQKVYPVWGLTARILIDAARIGFAKEPEMEYIDKVGDELLISNLVRIGELGPERDREREMATKFSDLFDKELLAKL
ncbi:NUDIX hydrolase domain-like protein [Myxozyma melibiosi]|uniref:NUDIX hydrolase domain-like protein n=1 Tax=Myxozyma melibiosi TaxID=54550 RepID=A0ABR1FCG5_9ASCO